MKGYIILAAVLLEVLGTGQTLPAKFDEPANKIWPIPQKNGTVRWMTRSEATIEALLTEPVTRATKSDKVRFFLYTHLNPTEPMELDLDDPETLARSTFDFKHPTRFMVHGWNGVYTGSEIQLVRNALLDYGKYNFIAVDWSVYGQSINYILAQGRCSKAGIVIAEFIDFLYDHAKISFDSVALYGHSLGAHVVGFAGKNVQRGRIHTIIGLDPAMPLFLYDDEDNRLSTKDAEYVESIQTNGGTLGFYNPIGLAAFYPNGGRAQPGCGNDIAGACAHVRAVEFLAEALRLSDENEFNSVKCSEFDNVKSGACNVYAAGIRLGDPNNAGQAIGIYYLETNSESPYGIGNIFRA